MATALIAKRARSTLVLVHRRPLLDQWISRLAEFLDISPDEIGSPATTPGASGVDVAMVQTLTRREDVDLRLRPRHRRRVPSRPSLLGRALAGDLPARAITGLTATPRRRDGHHPIITMQCGPVRRTLTRSEQIETATRRCWSPATADLIRRGFPSIRASRRSSARSPPTTPAPTIAHDVVAELTEDRFLLVLAERREHLNAIAEPLEAETDRIVVLHGGMGVRARRRAKDMLSGDGPRVVLAAGLYMVEASTIPAPGRFMLGCRWH